MRPFELLVVIANLAFWVAWLAPIRLRHTWILRLLALSGALLVIVHLVAEGYRWQLIPGYVLTALAALIGLWPPGRAAGSAPPGGSRLRRWALGLPSMLVCLLTAALAILFPIPQMPELTGSYPVGTVIYHWIDMHRPEIYTEDPDDLREIMVQIWYPAAPAPGAQPGLWMAEAEIAGPAIARRIGLPPFLLSHLNLVRTRAFPDAPLADSESRFPILLFSHGWGGIRTQNTTQMEDLASHGYVVAALDHTYGAAATVFPDGRVALWKPEILPSGAPQAVYDRAANQLVGIWAQDLGFAIDQLAALNRGDAQSPFIGRLDLGRVGLLGHSTGGGTVVELCFRDSRCRAGLAMDAWLEPVSSQATAGELAQPFLFMHSEDWEQGGFLERNSRLQAQVFAGLGSDGYQLTIQGTKHFDFSSFPLFSPLTPLIGFKGPIEGERVIVILNEYSLAFFDRYLKGQRSPLLDGLSPAYPEVSLRVK